MERIIFILILLVSYCSCTPWDFKKAHLPADIREDGYAYNCYIDSCSTNENHTNPKMNTFFFPSYLKSGVHMMLNFNSKINSTYLPQKVAESLPFSSKQLPEILKGLLMEENSYQAKSIERTIRQCEAPGIEGEVKTCATSLESMLNFSMSILGRVKFLQTQLNGATLKQEFTLLDVLKVGTNKSVLCHKRVYSYANFKCHMLQNTVVYRVSMLGVDGHRASVVAACHYDTSKWDPRHISFKLLRVKPGETPICHMLGEDGIAWIQETNK